MRRIVLTPALLAIALILALVPGGAAQAKDGDDLRVPYNFLLSAVVAGTQRDADPPGANDWDCEPSERHPRPVILVHGLTGNKNTNWQTFSPLLKNQGYCVFALTYGVYDDTSYPLDQFGGLTRMQESARELKAFAGKVLRRTGAEEVDILGHSEGTLMPNYWVKYLGGASKVHTYVSLAPLWHGTNPAGLAQLTALGRPFGLTPAIVEALQPYFASGPQFLTGSDFMTKMRRGGTAKVPGVEYTNIVTKYDELVVPYISGIEPGMTNHVVQDHCQLDYAEHFEIVADPVAAALVLNALDPEHSRPVPCQLVLPFVGPGV